MTLTKGGIFIKKLIVTAIVIALACTAFGCTKSDNAGNSSPTTSNVEKSVVASATAETTGKRTLTGLHALSPVHYVVGDPDNTAGLDTTGIEYGFGAAKDGKPNQISVANQKYFDNWNAFCLDQKTEGKVLYLTFDCGYENGYTAPVLDTLKEKKVPAAFFVTLDYLKSKEGEPMAVRMIKDGHIVGNHSSKHPVFPEISRTRMAEEIENCDNYLRETFGYSSPYFRFPTGEYSDCALDAVKSLGYTSVFWSIAYFDYDTEKQPSPETAFNTLTSRLHPGAVILLHSVSTTNAQILGEFIDYARGQGYTFLSLSKYPV